MNRPCPSTAAGRAPAAQEAPGYLKGLLSWRDQLKKGRLTIYLVIGYLGQMLRRRRKD
jgi:hypothetical protein